MEPANKGEEPLAVQDDEVHTSEMLTQPLHQVLNIPVPINESDKILDRKDDIIQSVHLTGAEVRTSSFSYYSRSR